MAEDIDYGPCDMCGQPIYTPHVRQGLDVCDSCAETMAELDPEDAAFWDD